jgi:hypothetical protein
LPSHWMTERTSHWNSLVVPALDNRDSEATLYP